MQTAREQFELFLEAGLLTDPETQHGKATPEELEDVASLLYDVRTFVDKTVGPSLLEQTVDGEIYDEGEIYGAAKPRLYPFNYCRFISDRIREVLNRLIDGTIQLPSPDSRTLAGIEATKRLLDRRGVFRRVSVATNGRFHTAFQVADHWADAAPDALGIDLPRQKVQIVPVNQAGISEIRTISDHASIMVSHNRSQVYANDFLPAIALFHPVIEVGHTGIPNVELLPAPLIAMNVFSNFGLAERYLLNNLHLQTPPEVKMRILGAFKHFGIEFGNTDLQSNLGNARELIGESPDLSPVYKRICWVGEVVGSVNRYLRVEHIAAKKEKLTPR